MFIVYMLKCSDSSYYVGHTDDIQKRFLEHQSGKLLGYTFLRRPVNLVFLQSYKSRDEAIKAETQIKSWSRKKKEALIKGDFKLVSKHARKIYFSGII
jgi:tRNA/rRNA methyltransferase